MQFNTGTEKLTLTKHEQTTLVKASMILKNAARITGNDKLNRGAYCLNECNVILGVTKEETQEESPEEPATKKQETS